MKINLPPMRNKPLTNPKNPSISTTIPIGTNSSFVNLLLAFTWIGGVVIANGFWSTLFAIFFPFWAWYLFIEKVLVFIGVV